MLDGHEAQRAGKDDSEYDGDDEELDQREACLPPKHFLPAHGDPTMMVRDMPSARPGPETETITTL